LPFWYLLPLYCLSFFHLRLLIALLVSFAIILCVFLRFLWLPFWYLRFTASDCRFGILDLRLLLPFWSLYCHYIVPECALSFNMGWRILVNVRRLKKDYAFSI
jgi:hypothetical protein